MKKSLSFCTTLRRENMLSKFILDSFLAVASYPRLLMEVFIRRNFGQRYFSLASAISVAVIMGIIPLIGRGISALASRGYYGQSDAGDFWLHYGSWYLFLLAFLYFSYRHWQDNRQAPSVFDFSRFSLYSGDIHPFFRNLTMGGKRPARRMISILLEPVPFLAAGLLLTVLGQHIGIVLMVCSLVYSLSYRAAYKKGDDYILDHIDKQIMNDEKVNAFVDDLDPEQTRGIEFFMRKPSSKTLRQRVAESFLEDDKPDDAPIIIAQ